MGTGAMVQVRNDQVVMGNNGKKAAGMKRAAGSRTASRHAQSLQPCLTLCDPMDCSPSESSVHGISQARRLEWVAISFSRGSPDPRIEPGSPGLAGGFFTTELPELSVCKIIDHQNIFCTSRYIKFCISQVIVTVFWLANNGLYTTKFHS